jgi:hypothetical protein
LEWGGNGEEGGGVEEREVSLRVTWDRDRITPKEGFQVSKREREEGNGEGISKGSKNKGIAP